MVERKEKWSIKKNAHSCFATGYNFKDKDIIISQILFLNGEYVRRDFCERIKPDSLNEISTWKTQFLLPKEKEVVIKKEGVEGLLRSFIAKDDQDNINIIYILAIMLERKKLFIERDVRFSKDQKKIRIYEHRKTNESFLIIDPMLNLNEIDKLTEDITLLLGGKPRTNNDENLSS